MNSPTAGRYHYHRGWIGVDLDGTLAKYPVPIETIGAPIWPMVDRIKGWLARGIEVRIVTARVAECQRSNDDGVVDDKEFADAQRAMIESWTLGLFGQALQVTAQKDFQMTALWDDRAISVETNTGKIIGPSDE